MNKKYFFIHLYYMMFFHIEGVQGAEAQPYENVRLGVSLDIGNYCTFSSLFNQVTP